MQSCFPLPLFSFRLFFSLDSDKISLFMFLFWPVCLRSSEKITLTISLNADKKTKTKTTTTTTTTTTHNCVQTCLCLIVHNFCTLSLEDTLFLYRSSYHHPNHTCTISTTNHSVTMTAWDNTLKRLLRRGKVTTAAVLDLEGRVLAAVPELASSSLQGRQGLVRATASNYAGTFKLSFGGTCYTCLLKDRSTLLGCADSTVLVVRKVLDVVLLGMASSDSQGSCLYEITEVAKVIRRSEKKKGSASARMVVQPSGA